MSDFDATTRQTHDASPLPSPPEADRGDWIQTFSGTAFYPADPRIEEIALADLRHALSLLCRFGGHCSYLFTVLQHTLNCVEKANQDPALRQDKKLLRTILLHDASEAWLIDLPRPVKHMLPDYMKLERRVEEVLAERFDLYWPMPAVVKLIDNRMLVTEARQLLLNAKIKWWEDACWPAPYTDVIVREAQPEWDRAEFDAWCRYLNIT